MEYGFKIEFPEAVRGSIALCYGAHFGLGLFMLMKIIMNHCHDP